MVTIVGESMTEKFYSIDPEVLGGTPVFSGTRVPIKALFDNLSCGETVEQFLENFPGVRPEQVQECLDQASAQFNGDNEAAA